MYRHCTRLPALSLLLLSAACGPTDLDEPCNPPTLEVAVCDPDVVTFTLDSTNPYYPLVVGSETILEGEEDGVALRVERRVLSDTQVVAGVETHILEHKAYEGGQIHEIAYNYYVEAEDGTVCYFGEDVEFYEGGELANTDGTWLVGQDGALPGIIMPASPAAGDVYYQEVSPGIAEDMGRIEATDATDTFAGQDFEDVLIIQDSNPLEDCEEEEKRYVAGIGEVVDVELRLISYSEPGP